MAAKVVWYREAWWIRTRWGGNKKKDRRIGPARADKRQAEEIAKKINAALALGVLRRTRKEQRLFPAMRSFGAGTRRTRTLSSHRLRPRAPE